MDGPIEGSDSPPPDEVTLGGQRRTSHESLARRHGQPRFLLGAAGVIGALAGGRCPRPALHTGRPAALRPSGPIKVVTGNTRSFAVQGTAGAVVQVQYLRVDHGR